MVRGKLQSHILLQTLMFVHCVCYVFVLHTLLTFKQLLASMQWSIRISVSAELLVCVLVKNGLVTVNDPDLE